MKKLMLLRGSRYAIPVIEVARKTGKICNHLRSLFLCLTDNIEN